MDCAVEFFIEKVRSNSCLWNMNHVAYRDLRKKDIIWERIGRECGLNSGRQAKNHWKKLRDCHREALRRRKPENGPSAHLRKWKYEEQMKFILQQNENNESIFLHDSNDAEISDNDNVAEGSSTLYEMSAEETMVQDSSFKIDPLYTDAKRNIDYMIDDREERGRHCDEMRHQVIDNHRSDALSKLFESMCDKTRELPKFLQLRVQREVFEAVTRAEEEALNFDMGLPSVEQPVAEFVPKMHRNSVDS